MCNKGTNSNIDYVATNTMMMMMVMMMMTDFFELGPTSLRNQQAKIRLPPTLSEAIVTPFHPPVQESSHFAKERVQLQLGLGHHFS